MASAQQEVSLSEENGDPSMDGAQVLRMEFGKGYDISFFRDIRVL